MSTFRAPPKDPAAVLDYAFDWSTWLEDGESIVSHAVEASGATVDSDSRAGAVVTVWLSGGSADTQAIVGVTVATTAGRTDRRSVAFSVAPR